MDMGHSLLTPDEVANYLGVEHGTLAVWRCTGRYNLPHIKIGSKVRYRMEDIEAFIEERTQTHTGEGGESK
jgi:excisionase family DNA binding protein